MEEGAIHTTPVSGINQNLISTFRGILQKGNKIYRIRKLRPINKSFGLRTSLKLQRQHYATWERREKAKQFSLEGRGKMNGGDSGKDDTHPVFFFLKYVTVYWKLWG